MRGESSHPPAPLLCDGENARHSKHLSGLMNGKGLHGMQTSGVSLLSCPLALGISYSRCQKGLRVFLGVVFWGIGEEVCV